MGKTVCRIWVASHLRAVFTFVGPKKEVFSLRAFFKYCPDRSPPSTNPRQLWRKKKNPSIIYYCTVKITLLFFVVNVEVQEHLHLLLRRRGGPLRGWSASADELWGNTSGPSKSPHRQTCIHPRSPTCDSKMRFIPRCEKNRNKTLCSKVLTYCWMVFGWSKPSILSLMTTAFSWALRALGRHSDTSVIALQLLCKTHTWDKSRAFRNFSLLSLTWLYVLNKMAVLTLEIHIGSTLKCLKREVCLQLKILGGNSLKKQL